MHLRPNRLLENPLESFDELRTNGREFEIVDKIPFMLRFSKHDPRSFQEPANLPVLPYSNTPFERD
jgi:hypothetical protein